MDDVRTVRVFADGAGGGNPAPIVLEADGWSDSAMRELLDVLGISADALAGRPIRNSTTSRTKTLVPLADVAVLDALTPRFDAVRALCDRLGSTGLYPYAVSDAADRTFDARQFPRSSGYPEDPATGLAAAALAFGLLADGLIDDSAEPVRIRQGRAMGRPSAIEVSLGPDECWIGGPVKYDE